MAKKTTIGLLDTVIILLASCTLVVFIFWGVSQGLGINRFSVLPDWMLSTASKIFLALTTTFAAVLQWYLKKQVKESVSPNYLVWITLTTVGMCVAIAAVSKANIIKDDTPARPLNLTVSLFSKDGEILTAPGQVKIKFTGRDVVARPSQDGVAKFSGRDIFPEDTLKTMSVWVTYQNYAHPKIDTIYKEALDIYLNISGKAEGQTIGREQKKNQSTPKNAPNVSLHDKSKATIITGDSNKVDVKQD